MTHLCSRDRTHPGDHNRAHGYAGRTDRGSRLLRPGAQPRVRVPLRSAPPSSPTQMNRLARNPGQGRRRRPAERGRSAATSLDAGEHGATLRYRWCPISCPILRRRSDVSPFRETSRAPTCRSRMPRTRGENASSRTLTHIGCLVNCKLHWPGINPEWGRRGVGSVSIAEVGQIRRAAKAWADTLLKSSVTTKRRRTAA